MSQEPHTGTRYKQADLSTLVPAFRERVEQLLERMRRLDYVPVVFETLRSRERAAQLAKEGRGTKDSMHIYGVAADIICDRHGWTCAMRQCRFYDDLGIQAVALGLVWGGVWRNRVDKPHVQGIGVELQPAFRKLDPAKRDAFVRTRLRGPVKA